MDDMQLSSVRRLFSIYGSDILRVLDAVANEHRFKILELLLERRTMFREFEDMTGLGKTALSHHLTVLLSLRLIEKIKRGTYEITPDGRNFCGSVARMYFSSNFRKIIDIESHGCQIIRQFTADQKKRVDEKMKELNVNIVNLPPMKVASVRAIGKEPEMMAWEKLENFATPLGLFNDRQSHPIFGFNNPDPIKGQAEYGYEFWIKIDASVKSQEDVKRMDFTGGLYAATECNLTQESQSDFCKEHGILESWFLLNEWLKSSSYKAGNHQWLEKHITKPSGDDDLILELYMPIMRKE